MDPMPSMPFDDPMNVPGIEVSAASLRRPTMVEDFVTPVAGDDLNSENETETDSVGEITAKDDQSSQGGETNPLLGSQKGVKGADAVPVEEVDSTVEEREVEEDAGDIDTSSDDEASPLLDSQEKKVEEVAIISNNEGDSTAEAQKKDEEVAQDGISVEEGGSLLGELSDEDSPVLCPLTEEDRFGLFVAAALEGDWETALRCLNGHIIKSNTVKGYLKGGLLIEQDEEGNIILLKQGSFIPLVQSESQEFVPLLWLGGSCVWRQMHLLMALLLSNSIENLTAKVEISGDDCSLKMWPFVITEKSDKHYFDLVHWICWQLWECANWLKDEVRWNDRYGELYGAANGGQKLPEPQSAQFDETFEVLKTNSCYFAAAFNVCSQKNARVPGIWHDKNLTSLLTEMRTAINTLRKAFYGMTGIRKDSRDIVEIYNALQGHLVILTGWVALLEVLMKNFEVKERNFNGFLANWAGDLIRKFGK